MKKLVFFASLLILATSVLVSCGKDDSPAPGNEVAILQMSINAALVESNVIFSRDQTKQLADVLSAANKDKANYVKSGEIEYSDSYITIQGLKAGESLNNLTINLMNGQSIATPLNLGKITADSDAPIKTSTNSVTTFLNTVVNNLASKKSVTIQVVMAGGDKDLSNISITLYSKATYSW